MITQRQWCFRLNWPQCCHPCQRLLRGRVLSSTDGTTDLPRTDASAEPDLTLKLGFVRLPTNTLCAVNRICQLVGLVIFGQPGFGCLEHSEQTKESANMASLLLLRCCGRLCLGEVGLEAVPLEALRKAEVRLKLVHAAAGVVAGALQRCEADLGPGLLQRALELG